LSDSTLRTRNGIFPDVKDIMPCPDIPQIMLSVIARECVDSDKGIKDLGGECSQEAGLGCRVRSECRIKQRSDNDGGNEYDTDLVCCAMSGVRNI